MTMLITQPPTRAIQPFISWITQKMLKMAIKAQRRNFILLQEQILNDQIALVYTQHQIAVLSARLKDITK